MQSRIFTALFCLLFAGLATTTVSAQQSLAIKAGKIITIAGDPIEDGVILIRDGRIESVGKDLEIPVDARIVDASNQVVMPGFVEAHSSDGMGQANENNPIVPYVSVMDEINPLDPYFQEARRNGVTTVAITPGNSTMIGGQAAIIKTGGEFVDAMVLKSDAGIKISLRPVRGSRMSHLAKLRETLDGARKKLEKKNEEKPAEEKEEATSKNGPNAAQQEGEKSDEKKQEAKPAEVVESELDRALFALLDGKLPAIIYCDKAMDVGAALRLIEEYKLDAKLILGTECYKAATELVDWGRPVVLDSEMVFWEEDARTREETKVILPAEFLKHEIPFTFQIGRSNSATLGRNYLWYQAATAVRYGMPEKQALAALTLVPAQLHGIDQFVGTIETGKDADLVILSGDPLKVDTWVEKTIVNGEVVYEKEKDDQLKRLLTGQEAE